MRLAAGGHKIAAIEFYRQESGKDLAEGRSVVESIPLDAALASDESGVVSRSSRASRHAAAFLAATVLGSSQPTVSVVIARLEREVGFPLSRQSRGRLEPTPEAFHLHEVTSAAPGGVERVVQTAREIRETRCSDITVISYPGIAWSCLPVSLASFATCARTCACGWSREARPG